MSTVIADCPRAAVRAREAREEAVERAVDAAPARTGPAGPRLQVGPGHSPTPSRRRWLRVTGSRPGSHRQRKNPDDLSDVYRGRADPSNAETDPPPIRYVPAAPLSLADAASQLGIRPVQLAQAVREGKVATVRGRGGELLIAHDELERVGRDRVW